MANQNYEEAYEKDDTDRLLYVVSGATYGIQIKLANFAGISNDVTSEDLPQLFIIKPSIK